MENKSVALAHTPSTASPAGHLRQTIYGRLSQTVIEVKPIQNKYRAWTDEQKIELSWQTGFVYELTLNIFIIHPYNDMCTLYAW